MPPAKRQVIAVLVADPGLTALVAEMPQWGF